MPENYESGECCLNTVLDNLTIMEFNIVLHNNQRKRTAPLRMFFIIEILYVTSHLTSIARASTSHKSCMKQYLSPTVACTLPFNATGSSPPTLSNLPFDDQKRTCLLYLISPAASASASASVVR